MDTANPTLKEAPLKVSWTFVAAHFTIDPTSEPTAWLKHRKWRCVLWKNPQVCASLITSPWVMSFKKIPW